MTHEQQLKQLLTEAEEVTAKMREALAKMETPAQWTPKKGDWAEVLKLSGSDYNQGVRVGDIVEIYEYDGMHVFCKKNGKKKSPNGDKYVFLPYYLRHLPDYKPQPKLATTYEEVVEAVKPLCWVSLRGSIFKHETSHDLYQLPTEAAAKQSRAYTQIKNLEAYCADRFEGERDFVVDVTDAGGLASYKFEYGIIKVTREAAEWLIANHPEPFLVFFGVK